MTPRTWVSSSLAVVVAGADDPIGFDVTGADESGVVLAGAFGVVVAGADALEFAEQPAAINTANAAAPAPNRAERRRGTGRLQWWRRV